LLRSKKGDPSGSPFLCQRVFSWQLKTASADQFILKNPTELSDLTGYAISTNR
jgi:hypothetical protein